MLNDSEVRKLVYGLDLIDKTYFDETKNSGTESLKQLKHAQRIYFRAKEKQWKKTTLKKLIDYFKDKKFISSGLVAVGHRVGKNIYTQYCNSSIVESKKKERYIVDIDFCIYFNADFRPKK